MPSSNSWECSLCFGGLCDCSYCGSILSDNGSHHFTRNQYSVQWQASRVHLLCTLAGIHDVILNFQFKYIFPQVQWQCTECSTMKIYTIHCNFALPNCIHRCNECDTQTWTSFLATNSVCQDVCITLYLNGNSLCCFVGERGPERLNEDFLRWTAPAEAGLFSSHIATWAVRVGTTLRHWVTVPMAAYKGSTNLHTPLSSSDSFG